MQAQIEPDEHVLRPVGEDVHVGEDVVVGDDR
ncbi:MAG: hypothetical protein JWM12_2749 [Ilumatobacteraceae bacterium]|nr:hypothetical protein [Ilumatobacteraceae bacterium]